MWPLRGDDAGQHLVWSRPYPYWPFRAAVQLPSGIAQVRPRREKGGQTPNHLVVVTSIIFPICRRTRRLFFSLLARGRPAPRISSSRPADPSTDRSMGRLTGTVSLCGMHHRCLSVSLTRIFFFSYRRRSPSCSRLTTETGPCLSLSDGVVVLNVGPKQKKLVPV